MSQISHLQAAIDHYDTEMERAQKSDIGPAIGLLAGAELGVAVKLYLIAPHAEELRQAKEQAWDEGAEAVALLIPEHEWHDRGLRLPTNPYRSQE